MMSIFLLPMGLFINAPLEELANGNVTPAVAKAPWYFLGLQELLAYFHPTVAGVLVPTFVLVGAALIPYVDRGNILATRPSQRKTAVVLFTLFCILGLVLTFVGIFFRGPGYTFVIPYVTSARHALLPVTTPEGSSHEQLPRRTGRQAPGPDEGGDQGAPQASRSRACRAVSCCGSPSAPASGLWLLEVTRGHVALRLAEPRRAASAALIKIGTLDDVKSQNTNLPIAEGFPAYYAEARAFVVLNDPAQQRFIAGRGHDRRRARRSTSARSTSAARTSAASRTRASRTSGSSARATGRATTGSGSRPTAPQYGPAPRGMDRFSITVDGGGVLTIEHRQDHARPVARGRSASPGSSRRGRRPAASDADARPAYPARGDR